MNVSPDIEKQVDLEKTVLLYKENRQGLVMSLLVATLISLTLSSQVGFYAPLTWWLIVSFILLARMSILVRVQTTVKLDLNNAPYWRKMFVAGAGVYGLSWGIGMPYFAEQTSFELMLLCVMVMISLCIGAVPYLFYSIAAVNIYLFTILFPITLWLLMQAGLTESLAAITCVVFSVSTYLMARKLNALMTNTMRLQLENAGLSNELIRTNYELKALSSTDPLSGIANRRAFEKEFEKTLGQMRRDNECLSILMIDIDHFKQFNDQYGHLAGDKIIRLVAETLSDELKRPSDVVARYGGEEFIVMLPRTDINGALRVAESMRESITSQSINDIAANAKLSISVGVTARSAEDADTLLDYVRWADQALYAAKEAGRNCVKTQLPNN